MRVTIIHDNTVVVDGVAFGVDTSALPAAVHVVQWDGARGEIEYGMTVCDHCGVRSKKGNETFFNFTPYQPYVDAWQAAKTQADALLAEAVRKQAEAQGLAEAEQQQTVSEAHASQ